ncbi:glutamate decarboxylase [Trichoderma reesei QM6a]|uniref:Glutamate decarboxylase n=2 Tax=Hypocrea jecorina TaxID=51453 RepID=G0RM37_HYPJQ|nr:glutamate decarboxylase [Trichoderma reesei QM6a]EGR47710.1 glutamate decarboxylase [Trichoderma reesei QM6a]ETS01096.1 PLP-dependent transferase [Trichoderma reesei RUT C-30]
MSDLFDINAQALRLQQRNHSPQKSHTLPPLALIHAASAALPKSSDPGFLSGQPAADVARHITEHIVPALCGQSQSSRYFGFVTGGVLPLAEWADNVVSRMDQNVQVHLPEQSVSTIVENSALEMLIGLLRLESSQWQGRTFTTGATASNVLGLACGREAVLAKRGASAGEQGLLGACVKAGVSEIQVLTSGGHSSLSKAASVVGLGRASVKELPRSAAQPWKLDLDAVEKELSRPGTASIIAVSMGEVNTGGYALDDVDEWKRLRELADRHGAWIHADGAFGIFCAALDDRDEHRLLHRRVKGIDLADSITIDGHKMLNVPYDCGMFFTRTSSILESVFVNPNAAYLSAGPNAGIPSPLNVGLENSRRFRALPAYAVLLSEGRPGFARLFHNMTQLSRKLAVFLRESPYYDLLPDESSDIEDIFIIVLFRAKDKKLNDGLVAKINATRQLYVSGTSWKGEKAVRVAVSNWKVDVERDFKVVTTILNDVAEGREFDIEKCASSQ